MTDQPSKITETEKLGYRAYQEGVSRRGNPYKISEDEDLCMAWIRGYNIARTERAIFPEHPVGTFIHTIPGGLGGLRKVGTDRWEMIEPDGAPTDKFVADAFARMLFEANGAELDIPDQEL